MRIESPYHYRQIFARWSAMLVMLLLINMLIDVGNSPTQVWQPQQNQEVIAAVNDIETIYEWALESLMDIENAVPESDTPEEDDAWAKKSIDWCTHSTIEPFPVHRNRNVDTYTQLNSSLITRAGEIIIPPPRA